MSLTPHNVNPLTRKRYRSPVSPLRKKPRFLNPELDQVNDFIIEAIAENPELGQRLRDDYIAEYLARTEDAQTTEELHEIATPYLVPLDASMSRVNSPFSLRTPQSSSSSSSNSPFSDEPTEHYYPMEMVSQKAHGTGVSREQPSNFFFDIFKTEDLGFVDLHNTGQHYGPGVYPSQVFPSFVSMIKGGYKQTQRQGFKISMLHFSMRLQIILPETQCTEASAGKLNDELRILIVKDIQPQPNVPRVEDVLSVHDSHHTINAFHNPATADRFTVLYDTSFFMQYTTIWEYTRGGGIKMAQFLPVDMKESIDIDLTGHTCSFDPAKEADGYPSLIDYNLFAIFISARGIKLTGALASDVKEAETFKVDWSARIVFK